MVISAFLAQVIGIYVLIMGVSVLTRRQFVMGMVSDLISNKPLIYVIAIIELLAGISLVVGHNIWVWSWPVIITIIGWLMVFEGAGFVLLPHKTMKRVVKVCNTKNMYYFWSILVIVMGVYLISVGFRV